MGKNMRAIGPPTDEVMDYRGLSGYVKLVERMLRKKLIRGRIPFYKIGSSMMFSKKRIDAWLKEHKREQKRTEKKWGVQRVITMYTKMFLTISLPFLYYLYTFKINYIFPLIIYDIFAVAKKRTLGVPATAKM